MTIKEELKEYCNYCINDVMFTTYEDYISCVAHKNACKRLLRDFEKEEKGKFLYYWDEEEAQKIVKWFSCLRHSKGVLAGQPIILTKWQKFIVCQIYGWKEKGSNIRRFKKSFIEVARKNAKSQVEAGISLYEISCFSVANNDELMEAYCAGIKRDQSKIVFEEAKLMLNRSPLKSKFKITRDRITNKKTGSFLKPLAKEDAQKGDGTNPQLTILDEYHLHPDTGFYDMHTTGSKARKQPILMVITTAGFDISTACATQEYPYAKSVLAGTIDNDTYFADILELDERDKVIIKNIRKANPIVCSYKEGVDGILEDLKIAKDVPEKMTAFLTKTCNIWLNKTEDGYMDMAKFKKCKVDRLPYDLLKDKDVYIGIDISSKHDLCGITFEIPIKNDNGIVLYYIKTHSFIPDVEKLQEHILMDKQPFQSWLDREFITLTNTPIVDQQAVLEYCLKECEKNNWNVKMFCVDPHNASKFLMDLVDQGYNAVEVYQSKKSLNEPTVDFREKVATENIIYEDNPCFYWQMGNAKVIRDTEGLIKIDKSMQRQRIDEVDSTMCSHKLAMYCEFESNYDALAELEKCNW